jgi:glycerol dehydrogenase
VERDRSPELVLADTTLLAEAPTRFLRWGMGDALATASEAEACAASGAPTPREAAASDAGRTVARRCREVVEAQGVDALAAVERDEVTPAVEDVVEAALLHSALGFENAGLAAAQSLEIGCRLAGNTDAPHGELVVSVRSPRSSSRTTQGPSRWRRSSPRSASRTCCRPRSSSRTPARSPVWTPR